MKIALTPDQMNKAYHLLTGHDYELVEIREGNHGLHLILDPKFVPHKKEREEEEKYRTFWWNEQKELWERGIHARPSWP